MKDPTMSSTGSKLEWTGSNSVAMAHFLGVSLDEITASPLNNALVIRTPNGKFVAKVGEEVSKDALSASPETPAEGWAEELLTPLLKAVYDTKKTKPEICAVIDKTVENLKATVATAEKKARGQVVDYIEKVASEEEEWFCVRQTHLDEARELGGERKENNV